MGELLRDWRHRRRLSQLDLAVEAEVSARHLSFVETGRSKPSRELILHLAEHLEVPLRDRNSLLLAAGYALAYGETPLETMPPVQDALDKILSGHEPFPGSSSTGTGTSSRPTAPPCRSSPRGSLPELLALRSTRCGSASTPAASPRITNLSEYSAHLLTRLHRQAVLAGDPELTALQEELRGYPGVTGEGSTAVEGAAMLFVPRMRTLEGSELNFFSTLATFGTALDITVAELAIESFFPADATTDAALRAVAGPPAS